MKRMSRISCTLALLLLSLSAVPAANAALKAFSPATTFGGMPTWYQGQNGVAVKPCLEVGCGLIAEPGIFDPTLPIGFGPAGAAFPTANFPTEWFYFAAQSASFAVGASTCDVFFGLEFTTVNPAIAAVGVPSNVVGAVVAPFQRIRLFIGAPIVPGVYTVQHPWGTTTLDTTSGQCRNSATGSNCTIDTPATGGVPNFAGALGPVIAAPDVPNIAFSMDTFLKSTLAPAGALGDAATESLVTGGTLRQTVTVTAPGGATGTTASFIITGKTLGMDVQPGANLNLGATNIVTPAAVPQTVTVTNATPDTLTFPALVPGGAQPTDFPITSPSATVVAGVGGCSGGVLAPGAACSFDVTFTPSALVPTAPRSATITLQPTAAPVPPNLTATPPPAVIVNLAGTAMVNVTATAVGHGSITPPTQAVNAGTPVTFTVTPGSKKFKVKDVAEGAVLLAPSSTDATAFTVTSVGVTNHTFTATFMPSGDLDANGTLDVADAQKALKIVAGVQKADADDPDNTAVKVEPLVAGKPAPDAARAAPNIGDVLVILRRVVGLETW